MSEPSDVKPEIAEAPVIKPEAEGDVVSSCPPGRNPDGSQAKPCVFGVKAAKGHSTKGCAHSHTCPRSRFFKRTATVKVEKAEHAKSEPAGSESD